MNKKIFEYIISLVIIILTILMLIVALLPNADKTYFSPPVFIALCAVLLNVNNSYIAKEDKKNDKEKNKEYIFIKAREYDEGLRDEIKEELLKLKGKTIDSIQIVLGAGYTDNRKEVHIFYH